MSRLLSPDELEAALREIGAERYHSHHPFHKLLYGGELSKGQVRAWALNLGRRAGARPAIAPRALVEVVPLSPPAATGRPRYVLEIADARVEFGDDASSATLRRIVEALRSC